MWNDVDPRTDDSRDRASDPRDHDRVDIRDVFSRDLEQTVNRLLVRLNDIWPRARKPLQPKRAGVQVQFVTERRTLILRVAIQRGQVTPLLLRRFDAEGNGQVRFAGADRTGKDQILRRRHPLAAR